MLRRAVAPCSGAVAASAVLAEMCAGIDKRTPALRQASLHARKLACLLAGIRSKTSTLLFIA